MQRRWNVRFLWRGARPTRYTTRESRSLRPCSTCLHSVYLRCLINADYMEWVLPIHKAARTEEEAWSTLAGMAVRKFSTRDRMYVRTGPSVASKVKAYMQAVLADHESSQARAYVVLPTIPRTLGDGAWPAHLEPAHLLRCVAS